MPYKVLFFLCCCFLSTGSFAQFYTHGQIKFERNFSVKQAIQLEEKYKWARQYAKDLPDGIKADFELNFNKNKTEYHFQQDEDKEDNKNWISRYVGNKSVAFKNQVETDFNTGTQKALKQVYEKDFLIADSLVKFQWKIEDDIRVIAGYPCRKAITTIDDSVVVVAFYTNQIMISGGPESFNGLPGMILGLAIPRLYTTWFATDVSISDPKFKPLDLPKKTKEVNQEEYKDELKDATKSWWGDPSTFLWLATL